MENTELTESESDKMWSEAIFESKYQELPEKYFGDTLPETITTAKIFLNWFVGGLMPDKFDVSALIIKMLGAFHFDDLTPVLKLLQGPDEKGISPILGHPKEVVKLNIETDIAVRSYFSASRRSIPRVGKRNIMQKTAQLDPNTSEHHTTPEEVSIFYNNCWETLDLINNKDKEENSVQNLNQVYNILRYLGYLNLIISRYCIKPRASVTEYFPRAATKKYNSIIRVGSAAMRRRIDWVTPPPHSNTILNFRQVFRKGSDTFSKFLILELQMYKRLKTTEPCLMHLYIAGNLLHFWYNGQPLIRTFIKLCDSSGLTNVQLVKESFNAQLAPSLSRLAKVIRMYWSVDKLAAEITFPWCRLIDDKYMTCMSAKSNRPLLELWLTALAELDNNPNVWSLYPWNGTPPQNPPNKNWVQKITGYLTRGDIPLTEETRKTLTRLNKIATAPRSESSFEDPLEEDGPRFMRLFTKHFGQEFPHL